MIFLVAAVVITAVLIFVMANSIGFMEETIQTTSNIEGKKTTLVRFSFDRLKQIGIIKD